MNISYYFYIGCKHMIITVEIPPSHSYAYISSITGGSTKVDTCKRYIRLVKTHM